MARLNGEMLCCYSITPFHSTYQGGSVRPRDDVGIVPYDHDGPQSIQHTFAVGVPWQKKGAAPALPGLVRRLIYGNIDKQMYLVYD